MDPATLLSALTAALATAPGSPLAHLLTALLPHLAARPQLTPQERTAALGHIVELARIVVPEARLALADVLDHLAPLDEPTRPESPPELLPTTQEEAADDAGAGEGGG